MNQATQKTRSLSQNSVPSTPVAPKTPRRFLATASALPADLQSSLGEEAEDTECKANGRYVTAIEGARTGEAQGQEDFNRCPPVIQEARTPRKKPIVQDFKREGVVPVSPELARWIKLRCEDLKIRKGERKWAVEVVNDFRDNLLKFLKDNEDQPYFQEVKVFGSGSYFEMVKILKPNEFDMMLTLQSPSKLEMSELKEHQGLFYHISLSRPTRSPIRAFLLDDGRSLSASKILSEMHRLVRKFISSYKVPGRPWRWVVNRKRANSPAVTLSLMEGNKEELLSVDVVPALEVPSTQGWPLPARNGPDVDQWLGKKARRNIISKTCYFVPKKPKGRNLPEEATESWRISFSHIEKELIMSHGNTKTCCESTATKCCRKRCFKLLKCLIEGLKQRFPKELHPLCSYHGKTAFLHTLSIRFQDSLWAPSQLPTCFMHLLGALEGHARSGLLPHFFVPTHNLFSPAAFPRKALSFLTLALEEQRRQGLPLLMPSAPEMPLTVQPNPTIQTISDQPQSSRVSSVISLKWEILIALVALFIPIFCFLY